MTGKQVRAAQATILEATGGRIHLSRKTVRAAIRAASMAKRRKSP